jgi:hypothetical protein
LHFLILSDAYIPTEKQKAKLKKDFIDKRIKKSNNDMIFA